jgi:hypothetical protein
MSVGQPADARSDGDRSARIERLTERLALMQSDLGGLFYEMAIRDHLQLDLLVARAAAMQRVEEELHALQAELDER